MCRCSLYRISLLSVGGVFSVSLLGVAEVQGQITVPSGFAVDQLVGRLDNKTQRIEAIRNPEYGNGVVAASVSNGILTVRRLSVGDVAVVATRSVSSKASVLDLRFDTTGLFGGKLFVALGNGASGIGELIRIEDDGTTQLLRAWGTPVSQVGFTFDFSSDAPGFAPGCYLFDLYGGTASDGTELWRMNPDGSFVQLSANTLPPDRTDMDVRGTEFDRAGLFGGSLLLVDNDANQTRINTMFALSGTLSWSEVTQPGVSSIVYYRDIAVTSAGALGQFAYLLEARQDRVLRVDAAGERSDFAIGFAVAAEYDFDKDGAASLSISEDGNNLYVSDSNGVYRIRTSGNTPGPNLIAREPSLPGNQPFKTTDPIYSARLIWNTAITFNDGDVAVTNALGQIVPSSASGSGSQFLLIAFDTPLYTDTYTITVYDTVRSVGGAIQIDGDNDGTAGGNAVIQMMHLCPSDVNNNEVVDSQDFFDFLTAFFAGC